MEIIPQSQFNASEHAQFDLSRVFQCSDIQSLESDVEAVRRGLEEELCWRNKQDKKTCTIAFGPVVVGEATAVTDHIDVFQYYRLVSETN